MSVFYCRCGARLEGAAARFEHKCPADEADRAAAVAAGGPYVIRHIIGPLKIPTKRAEDGLLLHATPREDFERFQSIPEIEEAISIDRAKRAAFISPPPEFEVVTVAFHEAEEADRASRLAAPRRKKKEPEE